MAPRILDGLNEQSCFYNPSVDSTRRRATVPDPSCTSTDPSLYDHYSVFSSKGRAPSQPLMASSQTFDHTLQDPYRTWPHSPLDITDFTSQWAYFQPQPNQPLIFDPVPNTNQSPFGLDESHLTSNISPSHCTYTYETVASLLPPSMHGNDMDFAANSDGFPLHHPFEKPTSQTHRSAPPVLPDHSHPSQNSFLRSADPSQLTSNNPIHDVAGAATRKSKSSSRPALKSCTNCGVTTTPMWRRNPSTHELLCNACGIYLQTRNKRRPLELCSGSASSDDGSDDAASQLDDAAAEAAQEDWKGRVCDHCSTKVTSVWRRGGDGRQLCNACGVYVRMKGKERPLHLRSNKVKPRFKHI